jgi:hypothetical protein
MRSLVLAAQGPGLTPYHLATFQHRDDPGGVAVCVAISIPEATDVDIAEAARMANARRGRILLVADTAPQLERAVALITERCTHHQRLPLERAAAGAFGPTQ